MEISFLYLKKKMAILVLTFRLYASEIENTDACCLLKDWLASSQYSVSE